jgi:dipeptidase
LFATLRDHGERYSNPNYRWINGGMAAPCMHAGGVVANAQTTASWVTEMRKEGIMHWVTGTAAPCTSLFKPVRVEQPLDLGPAPTDKADDSLWWRHERFHRIVMRNPEQLRDLFVPERNALEAAWVEEPPDPKQAFEKHGELLERWTHAAAARPTPDIRPFYAQRYWRKRNSWARLDDWTA